MLVRTIICLISCKLYALIIEKFQDIDNSYAYQFTPFSIYGPALSYLAFIFSQTFAYKFCCAAQILVSCFCASVLTSFCQNFVMEPSKKLIEVETEYGPIRGCRKVSILGRDYCNFQKIPYMKAPVGKLRFRDPEAPESWTVPRDCTDEGSPFCNMNFLTGQFEGELDAMFINIYTTDIEPKKSLPVMVWVRKYFFAMVITQMR